MEAGEQGVYFFQLLKYLYNHFHWCFASYGGIFHLFHHGQQKGEKLGSALGKPTTLAMLMAHTPTYGQEGMEHIMEDAHGGAYSSFRPLARN